MILVQVGETELHHFYPLDKQEIGCYNITVRDFRVLFICLQSDETASQTTPVVI